MYSVQCTQNTEQKTIGQKLRNHVLSENTKSTNGEQEYKLVDITNKSIT